MGQGMEETAVSESSTRVGPVVLPMVLPRELWLFLWVVLAVTALAWGLAIVARVRHWGFPYDWPIFPWGNSFFDYLTFFDRFDDLHTAAFFKGDDRQFSYFAPGVPLYQFFYVFRRKQWKFQRLPGFVVFLATILAGVAWGFRRMRLAMIRAGLPAWTVTGFMVVSLVTSYPLLFSFERGNLETVIAIFITLGVWAFYTGRLTLAAVLWGMFGSVKLYPLLLVALFLSRREYRAFALTLVTAAVTTLASLWYIGPTIRQAQAGIQLGTNGFLQSSTFAVTKALCWDHSIFAGVKLVSIRWNADYAHLLSPFLLTAGAIMLVLYFVRIRTLPIANQVLILSLCEVLLPPSSFDYTLLQLYGAWGVLVWVAMDAARTGRRVRSLGANFVLLALVFTPSNFVAWRGFSYNGQFKCAVLVALLVLSIAVPLRAEPAANEVRRRENGLAEVPA